MNTQEQPYRQALAIKALQWVFCAFKPLTIEDLARAVALDSYGYTDSVVTGSFLLQICGSFIIVTSSGSVRFAHRSVKEYLTHPRQGGKFSFSPEGAHVQVAETCLSFLLSFEDASKWASLPTDIYEEAVGLALTGFEMYACFFWASHCENARTVEWRWIRLKDLNHLVDKFVSTRLETVGESRVAIASTAFQRWISLLWRVFQTDINLEDSMRYRLEDAISDPPTPLFTACIWDLTDQALRPMVQKAPTVNLRNHRGKSCLYLAYENGHDKIISTLTGFGAIVDAGHGRMIDAAIRGGNPAIVTHALKAGAEVWLPPTTAPIRPRKRHLRSLCSTEISSSDQLSDEDSVLDDSTEDLVTPFGVPGLSNKDSTPPEHNDLLERLRKASRRRCELLNYWRLANNMAAVDLRASDEPVIAEEASSYLTGMRQKSAIRWPPYNLTVKTCCYCFRDLRTSDYLTRR